MAGVIDTVGLSAGVSPNFSASSSAPSSETAASVGTPLQNPRILQDPKAGFITEYVNTSGQVVSQIPSAIAVAYLRQGLTADGHLNPPPSESIAKTV